MHRLLLPLLIIVAGCQSLPSQPQTAQPPPPGMSWDIDAVYASNNINTQRWPNPVEFEPLFKKDLSNAEFPKGSWEFKRGVLAVKGGGDIWTKEKYGNFELQLDFKCETNTNSGVFLRCGDIQNWLHTCIEVQILQIDEADAKHNCGAIFDCLAPSKQMVKPAGEWNHYVITAKDNMITVVLNGEKVIDMDLDKWTEAHKNPDGSKNKFNTAYKDMPRKGHIGLQYHGHPVWFRNLKIKKL